MSEDKPSFIQTTAQKKIYQLKKRVRIVQGGTSASKTFSILPFLITYAVQKPNQSISVVSESMPHLKRGAMKDFLNIMIMTGLYKDNQFNKTESRYKFTNGSYIEFFSADQPDRLRGARRDVLFVNECNNIDFESYHQLAVRTKKFIYLDFNPSSEFWVHTELINDRDSDFVILTYKDNEALDPNIVKEIEKAKEKAETSEYWANWWRVYGLGEVGMMQGVIYKDFQIIDELPSEARLLGGGLDFGYSVDPAAAVLAYRYNGAYIFDEQLYTTELTNPDIYNKLFHINTIWVCDSAEPKSIEELRRFGMKVDPALKGPDSVLHGIQLLQSERIFVTKRSLNLIKEMRNYCWDKNRQGETLAKPIDKYNHLLDACRYWALNNLTQPTGVYSFGKA
jgi:phage terminase large subunit